MRWQAILDALKAQREALYATDAASARNFFGGNLDHPDAGGVFRYSKRGQSLLYTKDSTVSEKWRELLASNEALHERYVAFVSAQCSMSTTAPH